jgi:glutathione S-transferase
MKLYYSPGACSLSPHIVLREAGLPFELEKVDLKTHTTSDGGDYYAVNPKGYVPALKLDDGTLLTEGPAITQYVADLKPESKLAPAAGTLPRYQVIEWLHFIGTEIHKQISPLFHHPTPEVREAQVTKIKGRMALVAKALGDKPYLMGEQFTLPDAYLFVMLRWSQRMAKEVFAVPGMEAYFERMKARPAVQAALAAEGL